MVLATLTLALAPLPASAQQLVLNADELRLQNAYEVMQAVTMGLMATTALGGTALVYNLPTALGDGACARDAAIFGEYGCDGGASLVHGLLGIATFASYTATTVLAFLAPDTDQGDENTVTDVLGAVHGTGIGLTALLGLTAANPELIGMSRSDQEFRRVLRTVHIVIALITASAFATHLAVDQID